MELEVIGITQVIVALAVCIRQAAARVQCNRYSAKILSERVLVISTIIKERHDSISPEHLEQAVNATTLQYLRGAMQSALELLQDMEKKEPFYMRLTKSAQMEARFREVFDRLSEGINMMGAAVGLDVYQGLNDALHRDLKEGMNYLLQEQREGFRGLAGQIEQNEEDRKREHESMKRLILDLQARVSNPGPRPNAETVARTRESWFLDNRDLQVSSKTLGRGGFGVVYKGKFRGSIKVAVKFLQMGDDRNAVKYFKREVELMTRMRHANLVHAFGGWYPEKLGMERGFGVEEDDNDDSTPFIVMELVEGGSLDSALRQGAIVEVSEKMIVLRDVADALNFMHAIQVVHRDLKPSNILVDKRTKRAKVTDFGLSKSLFTQAAPTTHGFGTPAYMAPEYLRDRKSGPECDVWSFGVLVWEVFSGQSPNMIPGEPTAPDGGAIFRLKSAILKGARELPVCAMGPDCPELLRHLVTACLRLQPERRPTFVQILTSLDHYIDNQDSSDELQARTTVVDLLSNHRVFSNVTTSSNPGSSSERDARSAPPSGPLSESGRRNDRSDQTFDPKVLGDNTVGSVPSLPSPRTPSAPQGGFGRSPTSPQVPQRIPSAPQGVVVPPGWDAATRKDIPPNHALHRHFVNARAGNPNDQLVLGNRYEYAHGISKDIYEAARWYRAAMEQGYDAAAIHLNRCLQKNDSSIVVLRNEAVSAARHYQIQYERFPTSPLAALRWAFCVALGIGVDSTRPPPGGVLEILIGRRSGPTVASDARVQNFVGVCFQHGTGVPRDPLRAVAYFVRAANQGFPPAQTHVGWSAFTGFGTQRNFDHAVEWYRRAATQGYARALNNLGVAYETGSGVEANMSKAVMYYQKAAVSGISESQFNLGVAQFVGNGLPMDKQHAVQWFAIAADQGHEGAIRNLAHCEEANKGQNTEGLAEKLRRVAIRNRAEPTDKSVTMNRFLGAQTR